MSAANGAAAPSQLLPLNNLVKPEIIEKLPNFSQDAKEKYFEGVSRLWEQIKSLPPEHPQYHNAHKKLTDVTNQIRAHIRKSNSAQTNNGTTVAAAQTSMGQDVRPPNQQPISLANGQLQITPKVANAVKALPLVVPPSYAEQGPDTAAQWIREARTKYAAHLQRYENYEGQLRRINELVEQRRREGKNFSEQEMQELAKSKANFEGQRIQAKEYIVKFRQQQEHFKTAGNPIYVPPPQLGGSAQSNIQESSAENGERKPIPQDLQARQQPEHHGQIHTVHSALNAARERVDSTERGAMSPTHAQSGQQSAGQGVNLNPQIKKELPTSQMPLNHITADTANQSSPHSQPPPSSQGPHPLSHQAAMASAAQRNAQLNFQQQSTPQSTTHAHPPMTNRPEPQNNNTKFTIPKDLKIGPPQPVSMGPARPTLTGGPSNGAPGQMGMPAIQRHPGFVLEGDGDRVLSKKRLQQLMREVTGASDGDDAEVMAPDVEETLLQVADDFIDQVISSACKLAKLRQSSQLDIRDIQIILERNYNIRVPGYASDELRTVKKIQPTQAWTQKLSAVQAAKVTGGKTDI